MIDIEIPSDPEISYQRERPRSLYAVVVGFFMTSPVLAAAFGASILLHVVFFSIRFAMPDYRMARERSNELEVVLVNARHENAPEKAEVLAQANLDGGGTTEQNVRPSTPLPLQPGQETGDALTEAHRKIEALEQQQQELLTQTRKKTPPVRQTRNKNETTPAQVPVSGLDMMDSAAAIARLEAQIDRNLQEYARRPRKTSIGSRAKEYRFAQYVEDWRQKVERIGALNYPEAARGKIYGNLMLTVLIRADGSVEKVEIDRSSGHKILDDAAVRIVQMGSPYAPFPPAITKDTDLLEITRTWTFTNDSRVRAN